jgi:hypothetical protein
VKIRSTLIATLVLLPVAAFAQDSTLRGNATPFHKGQWAAQFQAGTAFGSLGFIKFRSPTRALVLDLRISGAHTEDLQTDSSGTHFGALNSNAGGQVRFGWRRYSGDGIGAKVVSHYSLGMLAGFSHNASAVPNVGSQQSNGWLTGAFGDIGATYLITSKFGIGVLASASLSYQNAVSKSAGTKRRDWTLGGSAVNASLVATLYF